MHRSRDLDAIYLDRAPACVERGESQQLFSRQAKQLLRRGIGVDDAPLCILEDHADRHVGEEVLIASERRIIIA